MAALIHRADTLRWRQGPRCEECEFGNHCRGPNMDATPHAIISRIEGYTGLHLAEPLAFPELKAEIKRHTREARQNGIHVSPTFMDDGLVQADLDSGNPIETGAARVAG